MAEAKEKKTAAVAPDVTETTERTEAAEAPETNEKVETAGETDAEGETEAYACVYCRTGGETQLVRDIRLRWPEVAAISPSKLRYRRVNGKPVEEKVALFPGYIFLRIPDGFPLHCLVYNGLMYKVLRDTDNDWRLTGADRALAETLFESDGVFGFSKAFYENDRIHIVDGPLMALEGSIKRVNHRKRTAQVQLNVKGMDMTVWLGFELIER